MLPNYSQDAALRLVFLILVPSVAIVYIAAFVLPEVDARVLFVGNQFFVYAMAGVYAMHLLLCDRPRERWGRHLPASPFRRRSWRCCQAPT